MKDILLIAHFCGDFDGKGNNRFNYLAHLLCCEDINLEFITSDFSHIKKEKRQLVKGLQQYKITLIQEPRYKRNVSCKRLYSHYKLSRNLITYLQNRKRPDLIYCAVPSLDVGKVVVDYASGNNIKLVIDIQDLWPEAYKVVLGIPILSDIIFSPMKRKANYIYKAADEIVAVSQTYMDRAMSINKKCTEGHVVFLGTDLEYFDKLAGENRFLGKPDTEIWLAYVGTLGHCYNIKIVIDAIKLLREKGIENIRFMIMGDGPLRLEFAKYINKRGIDAEIMGVLEYGKMVGLLKACDIAVNPIANRGAQSIINKHADYAAAGLPILNTQESKEYRKLVDDYQMGLNCHVKNSKDLADKLLLLYNHKELREKMGKNSRRLAEEKFNRPMTYQKIVDLLRNN